MSMKITRFSDFNDGMDVAGRKPKKLNLASPESHVTAGHVAKAPAKRANRQAALDQAYADGYKTALLDVAYLDGSQDDPTQTADPLAMAQNDPSMLMDPSMMGGAGPMPPPQPFDPQVAAMMGNPAVTQAMIGG